MKIGISSLSCPMLKRLWTNLDDLLTKTEIWVILIDKQYLRNSKRITLWSLLFVSCLNTSDSHAEPTRAPMTVDITVKHGGFHCIIVQCKHGFLLTRCFCPIQSSTLQLTWFSYFNWSRESTSFIRMPMSVNNPRIAIAQATCLYNARGFCKGIS